VRRWLVMYAGFVFAVHSAISDQVFDKVLALSKSPWKKSGPNLPVGGQLARNRVHKVQKTFPESPLLTLQRGKGSFERDFRNRHCFSGKAESTEARVKKGLCLACYLRLTECGRSAAEKN